MEDTQDDASPPAPTILDQDLCLIVIVETMMMEHQMCPRKPRDGLATVTEEVRDCTENLNSRLTDPS